MHTTTPTARVLLVEDDLDVAAGIGAYLESNGVRVEFAHTASSAKALLQHTSFDLIVMDVQLPDRNGMSLCRELKSEGLVCPVLFLTARGAVHDKLQAFEAGAVDYVVKPFAPAELLARVRALVSHIRATGGLRINVGNYSLDLHSRLLTNGSQTLALHKTPFVLLRRLMDAAPGSVSREELCELLWGDESPPSDPLRMHVYELRRALADRFDQALIKTVRGVGYRFGAVDGTA